MARVQRRLRQNYQAGNAGATQASQEKPDDRVSQGTLPKGNHQDAHTNCWGLYNCLDARCVLVRMDARKHISVFLENIIMFSKHLHMVPYCWVRTYV